MRVVGGRMEEESGRKARTMSRADELLRIDRIMTLVIVVPSPFTFDSPTFGRRRVLLLLLLL